MEASQSSSRSLRDRVLSPLTSDKHQFVAEARRKPPESLRLHPAGGDHLRVLHDRLFGATRPKLSVCAGRDLRPLPGEVPCRGAAPQCAMASLFSQFAVNLRSWWGRSTKTTMSEQ